MLGVRVVHGDRAARARGGDRVSVLGAGRRCWCCELAVRAPAPVLGAGWLAVRMVETGRWAPVLRACCARGGDRVAALCAGCVL